MKTLAWLLFCVLSSSTVLAEDSVIYDPNPAHPWNRLSAALHSDAPLRFENPDDYAARALAGPSYDDARRILEDFVRQHREKLITDPVRHALLQGELWATFDQVSDATGRNQPARREIAHRCATLIRRLALGEDAIAALPDTYAAGVKSRLLPVAYDPEHHDAPFLPDDLFVDDGPWIMLGNSAKEIQLPAALQHVKATQGRDVFYAMIRLPGGKQATLDYLRELANFPQPYVANEMYRRYPYARSAMTFNPALPQFPAGTQVALVSRKMLVSSRGELVVSPIVEGVQLRVYAKDPLTAEPGEGSNQDFVELQLDPAGLLAGRAGLRVSRPTSQVTGYLFERATLFSAGNNCNNCHGGVGVHSLNTYVHAFGPLPSSPWFEPSSEARQNRLALEWKQRDYTWGLLSALLQSNQ